MVNCKTFIDRNLEGFQQYYENKKRVFTVTLILFHLKEVLRSTHVKKI